MRDVIIVGAGLAGLAAARILSAGGRSVLLLEGQDRVGGRTYSAPLDGEAKVLDWGAEWIIPQLHPRLAAIVDEFGGTLEPEPSVGSSGSEARRQLRRLARAAPRLR